MQQSTGQTILPRIPQSEVNCRNVPFFVSRNAQIELGIVPVNSLKCKNRISNRIRLPNSVGIVPLNLLKNKFNTSKFVKDPIVVGRIPERIFCCSDSSRSAAFLPSDVGIIPVMALSLIDRISNSANQKGICQHGCPISSLICFYR